VVGAAGDEVDRRAAAAHLVDGGEGLGRERRVGDVGPVAAMPRNSTGMMIGLPVSVISIFSIGITGNSVRYSRVRTA
jgi:hypothetical protein